MKQIYFFGLSILTVCLLFGLASFSSAVTTMDNPPLPSYPTSAADDVPFTDVTLQWEAPWYPDPDTDYLPTGYEVWYQWKIGTSAGSSNIESSGDTPINKMVKHPTTSVKLAAPLDPAKTYYWSVKAKRYRVTDKYVLESQTDWSQASYGAFITKSAYAFKIISPAYDNYQNFLINSALEWLSAEGAQIYGWELTNKDKNTKKTGVTSALAVKPDLEAGSNYTFTIKAGGSCTKLTDISHCVILATDTKSFKTQTLSVDNVKPPELVSPKDQTTVSLPFDLAWKLAAGAETYQYQIWQESPREVALGPVSTDKLSVNVSDLTTGVAYRWSVKSCWKEKATGLENCSDFAAERKFTVGSAAATPPTDIPAPVPAPEINFPINNAIGVSLNISLSWKLPAGQSLPSTGFFKGFFGVPTEDAIPFQTSRSVTSWTPSSKFTLSPKIEYTWGVQACKNSTDCSQYTIARFTTGIPDNECMPPYSDYGGLAPSCNECPAGYQACSSDQSDQGNYYCYKTTKVGTVCKDDATNKSGICDNQGGCFVKGSGASPVGGTTVTVCPEGQICNPLKYGSFDALINAIIKDFLIPVGISIAAIMFVIAGIVFVTSAGDPKRAKTAREIMIYTAIGLAVILIASGLVNVLRSLLGGS